VSSCEQDATLIKIS